MSDTTARLRELLERRRPRDVTLSIVLDEDAAQAVEDTRAALDALHAQQAAEQDMDEDVVPERRASDPDMSLLIAEAEDALRAALEVAAAARLDITMRLADARTYESVLVQHPDADTSAEGRRGFADGLLAACYQGATLGGQPLEPTPTWGDLLDMIQPTYGELDAWRTQVVLGCMSAPHGAGAR